MREAAFHGRPGVAISQYVKKGIPFDWRRASARIVPILRVIFARSHEPGTFWNINLPHLEADAPEPEMVFCPLDPSPLPLYFRQEDELWHYAGNYHNRQRQMGSDVDVCFQGKISVTRLTLI